MTCNWMAFCTEAVSPCWVCRLSQPVWLHCGALSAPSSFSILCNILQLAWGSRNTMKNLVQICESTDCLDRTFSRTESRRRSLHSLWIIIEWERKGINCRQLSAVMTTIVRWRIKARLGAQRRKRLAELTAAAREDGMQQQGYGGNAFEMRLVRRRQSNAAANEAHTSAA